MKSVGFVGSGDEAARKKKGGDGGGGHSSGARGACSQCRDVVVAVWLPISYPQFSSFSGSFK